MAELKTQVNKASVGTFLKSIKNPKKREDCIAISKLMEKVSKSKPEMWGKSIVGFGRRTYTYANGKTNEWMVIGFAPRAANIALYGLTVYTMTNGGLVDGDNDHLLKLGKFKKRGRLLVHQHIRGCERKRVGKNYQACLEAKKINMSAKHISYLVLALIAVILSGGMLRMINDAEGPNLLIVGVFAAVIFGASLAVNYFHSSNLVVTGKARLIIAVVVQIITTAILYFFLR